MKIQDKKNDFKVRFKTYNIQNWVLVVIQRVLPQISVVYIKIVIQ